MKLKMCTTCKIFRKICLKANRDIFFNYVVCNHEKYEMRRESKEEDPFFWWEMTPKSEVQILGMSGESPPESLS